MAKNKLAREEFRDLVVALHAEGQDDYYLRMQEYEDLAPGVQWFAEHVLSRKLGQVTGDFGKMLVPLKIPSGVSSSGKAVAGLWCEWNFEAETPLCRLELLVCLAKNQVYGFRLDHPHVGKHSYWHVQLTHQFTEKENRFPAAAKNVRWISSSTPAYPVVLDGTSTMISPRDAALYTAVSFYGNDCPRSLEDKLRSAAGSAALKTIVLGATAA